jgi:hypothetical protein
MNKRNPFEEPTPRLPYVVHLRRHARKAEAMTFASLTVAGVMLIVAIFFATKWVDAMRAAKRTPCVCAGQPAIVGDVEGP